MAETEKSAEKLEPHKILITGSEGSIGSAVRRDLGGYFQKDQIFGLDKKVGAADFYLKIS